jgi:FtsZ-binding cell division protein ZapB
MPQRFLHLRLLRLEIDRLEELRRLEMKLLTAAPGDRSRVEKSINSVVDEITQLSRAIQELKANRSTDSAVMGHAFL